MLHSTTFILKHVCNPCVIKVKSSAHWHAFHLPEIFTVAGPSSCRQDTRATQVCLNNYTSAKVSPHKQQRAIERCCMHVKQQNRWVMPKLLPKGCTANDFHGEACKHAVHLHRLAMRRICQPTLQVCGCLVHERGMSPQHLGVEQGFTSRPYASPKFVPAHTSVLPGVTHVQQPGS